MAAKIIPIGKTTTEQVSIYIPTAPSHGAAKKWVHNVNIWVVRHYNYFGNITSSFITEKYCIAREVDSRYTGNRSCYGQSLASAKEKANAIFLKMKKEEEDLLKRIAERDAQEQQERRERNCRALEIK